MKFCTVFLQIGNLQSPIASVPKPLISVFEKNFNRNINEVNISYKWQVKLAHFQHQFDNLMQDQRLRKMFWIKAWRLFFKSPSVPNR